MSTAFRFAALLLFTPIALAQTPDPCATAPQSCATLINTHATAETRLPSTVVDISVGITATEKDLPALQRKLSDRSSALLDWLRSQNVERLVTTSVSLSPEYRGSSNNRDHAVGYDGSTEISFRTTPAKASDLLGGVLNHGANNIESTNFTPTEEEIATARRELSADATRTAVSQADSIAKAAGMHVASVRSINVESDGSFNPVMVSSFAGGLLEDRKMRSAPSRVDTASGDRTLSMRVDVVVAATH